MQYNTTTRFFSDGDKDHDLFMFFSRVRYLAYRARERELQKYGLTPEQVAILFVVRAMDGHLTSAEIARMFLLQRHTISSMVDRMGKKGLIKKKPDQKNTNRFKLTITEKGEEFYQLSTSREPVHRIMQSLNMEESAVFLKCLKKIEAAAGKELGLSPKKLQRKTKKQKE